MSKKTPTNIDEAFTYRNWLFSIDFSIYKSVESNEPTEIYIDQIVGKIYRLEGAKDRRRKVGEITLYRFNLTYAIAQQESRFYLFSDMLEETEDLYAALFDKRTGDIKKSIVSTILPEGMFLSNLLYIHQLEIMPTCRGFGLGRSVANSAIHTFASWSDIVAVKPYPLQFGGHSLRDAKEKPKNKREAFKKVYAYPVDSGFSNCLRGNGSLVEAIASRLRKPDIGCSLLLKRKTNSSR